MKRNYTEIVIPALFFDEYSKPYNGFYGAMMTNSEDLQDGLYKVARNYLDNREEAILENGDVVHHAIRKCGPNDTEILKPDWIFSPYLAWNRIPEKYIEQMKECNCMWDYFGNVILDENYADPKTGWRYQFFIMKSSGEWQFRIRPEFRISKGFWHPVSPPKPKRKFEIKGDMKIYNDGDLKMWTNEDKFKERFENRTPQSQNDLLEKFYLKYQTIFKWLMVGMNKREAFWNIIKRDASRDMLHCYEIRL
jgi:hypothetical protein